MYGVHDWAEVHRLHHVEGLSKAAVAAKLAVSCTTVHRLLALAEPPVYRRKPVGSQLDGFVDAIAAMLDEDPRVPATVIAQRLRPQGFTGSLTILKDHVRRVRPNFVAARAFQRTSYLLGELAQTDWWEPGIVVPVGKGQSRAVFGLVTGLPFSAAFRIVFAFDKTVASFCPTLVGQAAPSGWASEDGGVGQRRLHRRLAPRRSGAAGRRGGRAVWAAGAQADRAAALLPAGQGLHRGDEPVPGHLVPAAHLHRHR